MRGYCAIGIEGAKTAVNVGTLWRSAYALDAAFIFTVGRRYPKQASDTVKAWRHVPLFAFDTIDDLVSHLPHDCPLVGVELDDRARQIEDYNHPERACYLLGAEDSGLPRKSLDRCHSLIQLPGTYCLNVATAGSIVLYDREVKSRRIGGNA